MSGYRKNGKFFILNVNNKTDDYLLSVEDSLNLAYDWYRIDDGLYILYTAKDQNDWYNIISNLSDKKMRIFICSLKIEERQGWMSKKFWKWIKEKYPEV